MIFGISTLEFAEVQKIEQKKKKKKEKNEKEKTNLGPKLPYLGILGCKFEKVLSYLKSGSSNL